MILAPLFGVVSRRGIGPRLQCFTRCKVTKHAHIFFYIPLYLADYVVIYTLFADDFVPCYKIGIIYFDFLDKATNKNFLT